MKRISIQLLILLLCLHKTGHTKVNLPNCLAENIITSATNDLDSLCKVMTGRLPSSDFYLVGEAHTFLANNHLQWSMIKALHQQGVYNIVNELPHATCFLFNYYLQTGDITILEQIKPQATYVLLQQVRAFNETVPVHQQIRYFGIDYLDPKYDFSNLQLSLKIILNSTAPGSFHLDTALRRLSEKDSLTGKEVIAFQKMLYQALKQDVIPAQAHYRQYYEDMLLMASNMVGYRSNRDNLIYKSFIVLYDHLKKTVSVAPKFLSFYGVGHLSNLGNKLLLRKDSPVSNKVCKIGIKYFDCIGGWNNPTPRDEGIFSIPQEPLQLLKNICRMNSWTIGIMVPETCITFKYKEQFDAVVLFNRYGTRSMHSWKFD